MLLSVILVVCGSLFSIAAFAETTQPVSPERLDYIDEGSLDNTGKEKDTSDLVTEALNGGKEVPDSEKGRMVSNDSMWTIYAQFIMSSSKKNEKGSEDKKDGGIIGDAISSVIGDGGVSLDVPYNKMNSLSNEIRGKKDGEEDKSGTQVASFLSTYSNYNYIDTVSGNRIASETSNGFVYILKQIAGMLIMGSLTLYYITFAWLKLIVNGMTEINPFRILGFGDENVILKNPISRALQTFFSELGLNNAFFTALADFGLIFIVGIFGYSMMKYLSDKNLEGVWKTLRKFGVQIFTMFAMIPILMLIYSEVGKGIKQMTEETSVNSNLASQYILNVRGWAASQNLAPQGLNSTTVPESTTDKGFIDSTYDPASSRSMIADLNRTTYNSLYGKGLSKETGYDLVRNWMGNSNFNVNTYFGDLNRGQTAGGDRLLPAHTNFKTHYPKMEYKDIEYAMWSGTQNINEELRDVTNEQFKPDKDVGVENRSTFSTQSVALMLQSSFDGGGAHFYAYNLAPSGLQGNMKNLSTVKTEWKSYTMPGDGPLGVFGSAVSLTAKSLGFAILTIACILALLTVNLFETAGRFFKSLLKAVGFGNFNQSVASFMLALAFLVSGLIAFLLPTLFINFITAIVGAFNKASNNIVPSGILEIITGVATLFLCTYLGWGANVGGKRVSPVKAFIGIPNDMALAFADRIDMMSGDDVKRGFTQGMRGAKQAGKRSTSNATKTASDTVKVGGRKLRRGATEATMTGAKEAVAGMAAGGVAGAVVARSKGAVKGGYSGYTGKGSKTQKAQVKDNAKATMDEYKDGRNERELTTAEKLYGRNNEHSYPVESAGETVSRSDDNHIVSDDDAHPVESAGGIGQEDGDMKQSLNGRRSVGNSGTSVPTGVAGGAAKAGKYSQLPERNKALETASNANEYARKLKYTQNGEALAMNTESAKSQLRDTEFVNEKGQVDHEKIKKFKSDYSKSLESGDVTPQIKEKNDRLDKAYRSGAAELYDKQNKSYNEISSQSGGGSVANKDKPIVTNTKPTENMRNRTISNDSKTSGASEPSSTPKFNHRRETPTEVSEKRTQGSLGIQGQDKQPVDRTAEESRNNVNNNSQGRINRTERLNKRPRPETIREQRIRAQQKRLDKARRLKEQLKNRSNTPDYRE